MSDDMEKLISERERWREISPPMMDAGLLEFFAAHVLTGLMANLHMNVRNPPESFARLAFDIAAAMVDERKARRS